MASHQSDPDAAAAVAAVIDIVREESLVQAAEENGLYSLDRLRALQSKHSIVVDVRGQGLMLGMELAYEEGGQDPAMPIVALCGRQGVHLTYSYFEPVLRFIPPLIITREQIDTSISVLDEALSTITRKDFQLDDFLPSNRYSRPYIDNLRGKQTVKRILSRL